jgi:hypothetical protein
MCLIGHRKSNCKIVELGRVLTGSSKTRLCLFVDNKTRRMPRMFSGTSIPDWILEAADFKLFQFGSEKKQTIIKRVNVIMH